MVGVLGAFYALRREHFSPVPPETILDDMIVPMRIVRAGRRVVFDERAVVYDEALTDAARERGRKVRTLAGNFQLLAGHPWLLAPWRNPIALQFYSHKVMRLLGPVALACAFAANIALLDEGALFVVAFAAQCAGYGLAVLGAVSPRAARLLPVRLPMAFASLNAFVVLGLVEYLRNRDIHLWKNPHPRGEDPRASG
jgi:biofilm PGA synthesis N-glycosyltransferase PgaC